MLKSGNHGLNIFCLAQKLKKKNSIPDHPWVVRGAVNVYYQSYTLITRFFHIKIFLRKLMKCFHGVTSINQIILPTFMYVNYIY